MVAVNYVGEELWSYFNAPWEKRVDLAWQLMEIAEQLTNNDFEFALYLLDVSFDNFAVGPRDGKVIIVDAENVLVADKRLIRQSKYITYICFLYTFFYVKVYMKQTFNFLLRWKPYSLFYFTSISKCKPVHYACTLNHSFSVFSKISFGLKWTQT